MKDSGEVKQTKKISHELFSVVNGGNNFSLDILKTIKCSDSSSLIYRRILTGKDFEVKRDCQSFRFKYIVVTEIGKNGQRNDPFILITDIPDHCLSFYS